jgi:hypothetical protein
MKRPEIGDQVYLREDSKEEEVGAVREVHDKDIVIYIENVGDVTLSADQVKAVHSGKVILDEHKLTPKVRDAIAHAHDREEPGL